MDLVPGLRTPYAWSSWKKKKKANIGREASLFFFHFESTGKGNSNS